MIDMAHLDRSIFKQKQSADLLAGGIFQLKTAANIGLGSVTMVPYLITSRPCRMLALAVCCKTLRQELPCLIDHHKIRIPVPVACPPHHFKALLPAMSVDI